MRLVTGSCGLIGSEVCLYFHQGGYSALGIDNNQRAVFFGPEGDTSWTLDRLRQSVPRYEHHDIDIRDREGILRLVESTRPAVIVHTAAQPSHDRAAQIAFDDFDTNAVGTLNLAEAARSWAPESPFIHMSTNKVYGDRPNHEYAPRQFYTKMVFPRLSGGQRPRSPTSACIKSSKQSRTTSRPIPIAHHGAEYEPCFLGNIRSQAAIGCHTGS